MVWSGNGVTYTELRQMDLAEYQECRQAKRLWVEQWRDEAKPKRKPNSFQEPAFCFAHREVKPHG